MEERKRGNEGIHSEVRERDRKSEDEGGRKDGRGKDRKKEGREKMRKENERDRAKTGEKKAEGSCNIIIKGIKEKVSNGGSVKEHRSESAGKKLKGWEEIKRKEGKW